MPTDAAARHAFVRFLTFTCQTSCKSICLLPNPAQFGSRAGAIVHANEDLCLCSCVLDTQPRKLDVEQLNVMSNFAELAVRHIEKDKRLHKQKQVCTHAVSDRLPQFIETYVSLSPVCSGLPV